MNEHRRRHRRLDVDLWAVEQGEGFSSWHHVSNISASGLFFEATGPLPAGTELRLDLEFPGGRVLKAKGEVVHATTSHREAGVGVRIVAISPDDREQLTRFLQMRLDGELEGSLSNEPS